MPHRRELLGGTAALLAAGALGGPAVAQRRAPARAAAAPPPSSPASTPLGPVDTQAKQAMLVDCDTGAVLLEKNADERMHPSSMSKLMTMYVVFDLLKQGRLQMEQTFPVSERAWRMGGSKMFVELGSEISVSDLSHGVIVQSGNDACVVLAEGISGSEQQFAELLNEYGKRIGLKDSTFRNATGWPDPEHMMTCRDLSILARRLINDFPEYYSLYNVRSFQWHGISQENRNPLLGRVPGADGLKTGHTENAGYGLTGTAKRGDRRLILVVNGLASMRMRGEESERLIEWGFREFENVTLFRASDTVEEAPVYLGDRATVPLVGGRDLVMTLPRQWRRNLTVKLRYDSPVPAPIAKGQELGQIEISGQGVPPMALPLYAGADIGRLGVISRIPAVIGRWVSG
ncbi:D-alanyl-D-alanine carboxypeptidase family protein [Roseomonas marmotae]|uniref:serine-type D-Ala-D-Ala carboxypeptidase n=1 Tax=Roseomonas marmotae TaxID=2768161 RepID=A0ABS3KCX6_9PROT|nr:D-alanyl-D-alanine carboxypeptidase family protein [Roseomonas marmotae]MBO1075295.1 D-alanyl-D-alanine carboxypeptidase [Roseomonas marmotae]QTI78276.1 D-alanyl-D-alanine carboxypeptidase [Roseomonas marmotae]